eukprot:4806536-Lingulodinium_polyedra.AAC.1
MSMCSKYRVAVRSKVLQEVHRFPTVAEATDTSPPGTGHRIPSGAFHPKVQSASMRCTGLVSTKSQAD